MEALNKTLDDAVLGFHHKGFSDIRKNQVGSGQRADKSVTIRFQDDKVSHHMTDKTMSATKYMRGFMDEVWQ